MCLPGHGTCEDWQDRLCSHVGVKPLGCSKIGRIHYLLASVYSKTNEAWTEFGWKNSLSSPISVEAVSSAFPWGQNAYLLIPCNWLNLWGISVFSQTTVRPMHLLLPYLLPLNDKFLKMLSQIWLNQVTWMKKIASSCPLNSPSSLKLSGHDSSWSETKCYSILDSVTTHQVWLKQWWNFCRSCGQTITCSWPFHLSDKACLWLFLTLILAHTCLPSWSRLDLPTMPPRVHEVDGTFLRYTFWHVILKCWFCFKSWMSRINSLNSADHVEGTVKCGMTLKEATSGVLLLWLW